MVWVVLVVLLSMSACGSAAETVQDPSIGTPGAATEPTPETATPTAMPAPAEPENDAAEPDQSAADASSSDTGDSDAEASDTDVAAANDGLFPTIVDAAATSSDGVVWRFDVTLSSPYDSPERYADAWRVLDADDNELGIRILGHDHANEQPFTRSTTVEIPAGVDTVFVEARDQLNGWNAERFAVTLNS